MIEVLARISAWRPGAYARSSGGLFAWLAVRAIAQMGLLLLLSRLLGAYGYGQVVAVTATAALLVPMASAGLPAVLLRDGARAPQAMDAMLSNAGRTWIVFATVSATLSCAIAAALIPDALPWTAAFAAISAEIFANSASELIGRGEQARHRTSRYGAIAAGLAIIRLAALGCIPLLSVSINITAVLWLYAATGFAYTAALWAWRRPASGDHRLSLREGLPFSLAALSARLQSEFNKPVLARSSFDLAGNFNAAQRVVDLASLPLTALMEAFWPRLYSRAEPREKLRQTATLLVAASLIGGGLLWLAAPLLPIMLGDSFDAAQDALRWLCWMPSAQLARNLLTFSAIESGRTTLIGWTYFFGAAVSASLVWWLVPIYGLSGAVIAAYLNELIVTTILVVTRRASTP